MANVWAPYFDKSNPRPAWLDPKPGDHPNTIRGKRRYSDIWQACPVWAVRKEVVEKYREARALRDIGLDYVVDHIVPLNNPLVCGLHVGHNLRVSRRKDNARKSNNTWPDMPGEQQGFEFPEQQPVQKALL